MEKGALHTANFTIFQDQLFDSLSARKRKLGARKKPLRQVVTDGSPHWEFWITAIKYLENMRYRTESNINPPKANDTRRRLIRTLKMMIDLWMSVKDKGFNYLKTGYVNLEPLENFFRSLKDHGERNIFPSCAQAETQFKTLMVANLSGRNSIGGSCLNDGSIMTSLKTLTTGINSTEERGNRCHEFNQARQIERKRAKVRNITRAKRALSAGNFAKLVLSHIKEIHGCELCFQDFQAVLTKNDSGRMHLKMAHGENEQRIANVDNFERCHSRGMQLLDMKLPAIGFEAHLRQSLKEALHSLDFEWVKCNDHRTLIKNAFKEHLVLYCIKDWSIHLNQILIGHKAILKGSVIEKEARRQYLTNVKRNSGMEK